MEMNNDELFKWLLEGDISIRYQVYRDLMKDDKPDLRNKIHLYGWGANFLKEQNSDGHWGRGYYQPKWISTHYTLLNLRNLWVRPDIPQIQTIIQKVLMEEKAKDGGIKPVGNNGKSDVCVNGMALNFLSYFGSACNHLVSVVDFILSQKLADGGYNCQYNRIGAVHSSLHSTISVLEGMREYINKGYEYRKDDILKAEEEGQEFILQHKFFKSDKTGKVIKESFLRFPYPHHWYYNILRALDYFRYAEARWDERMKDALAILLKKRKQDGYWVLNAKHKGQEYFSMESAGEPSRWNTLRALRVLEAYNKDK